MITEKEIKTKISESLSKSIKKYANKSNKMLWEVNKALEEIKHKVIVGRSGNDVVTIITDGEYTFYTNHFPYVNRNITLSAILCLMQYSKEQK